MKDSESVQPQDVELPIGEQNAFLEESILHWVVLLFRGNVGMARCPRKVLQCVLR